MTQSDAMPTVGMIGGGQLARMTHQAAIGLGVNLHVLSDSAHAAAARACPNVVIGSHTSLEDLLAFSAGCDVVTFDHEHVPGEHIRALEAAGVVCRPGSAAQANAQDKLIMRERMAALDVPGPRFAPVKDAESLDGLEDLGWPLMLKTTRGGYDGRGIWVCETPAQVRRVIGLFAEAVPSTGPMLLAEEFVRFERELAVLVARSPHGQGVAYPVVETVQRDGICHEVIAPAPGLPPETAAEAQRLALDIAAALGVTGLLAVEMFETRDGVVVNELAMRPHNSGHWTIEGARTSQFEQHLRAVLDLPLGDPSGTAPYVVMANVLGGTDAAVYNRYVHVMAHDPEIKVHFYGKEVRPGRKIGHVTALSGDLEGVRERARHAADYLRGK